MEYTRDVASRVFSLRRGFGNPETDERVMRFLNGEGSEVLARKFDFVNVVRDMELMAPRQVLVKRGMARSAAAAFAMEHIHTDSETYWKPKSGLRGLGIRVLSVGDAPAQTLLDSDDYIVQEKIPVQEDFRYWRIKAQGEETSYRHCYRSFRTDVIGDGTSTILQLLKQHTNPSLISKAIIAWRHIAILRKVPRDGEVVELVKVAHDIRGAYFERPDERRMEYLDRFMEQFTGGLEDRVGHQLPVLCFDIGVRDSRIFSQPFDIEKMKKNVVFFECQMPFDPGLDNNKKNASRVFALMVNARFVP